MTQEKIYPVAKISDYGYRDFSQLKKVQHIVIRIIVGLLILSLYIPVIMLAIQSVNSVDNALSIDFGHVTLKWYTTMFENDKLTDAIIVTLITSGISTMLSVVIGTLAAIGLYSFEKKRRQKFMLLNNIPILNADIVTGISVMMVATLILKPIIPTIFGLPTLIIAHLFFSIPYVILNVMPKLKEMDPNLMDAALDLGVKPYRALYKVIVPAITAGIFSGMLLAFTMSIDDFVISLFNSGSISNLSKWVYAQYKRSPTQRVSAFSTLLTVMTIVFMLIYGLINNIKKRRNEK